MGHDLQILVFKLGPVTWRLVACGHNKTSSVFTESRKDEYYCILYK